MNGEKILQKITIIPLYVAALLIPFFFLPITSEWLEWNKHYLLGILVVISLLAWLAGGLVSKKVTLHRVPFDIPLAIFLVFAFGATIFSKDRIISFFGPLDNVSWSLMALIFYILFALLLVWNIREEGSINKILKFLSIGLIASVVYFWLARFGLFDALNVPRWSPVSSLNFIFGNVVVLTLILSLGMLLISKIEKKQFIFWGIVAGLSFITILVLGFVKIWIFTTIGLFILLLISFSRLNEVRYPTVSFAMALFVISLVFLILGTPKFITVKSPTEIILSNGRSAQITFDTLKENVGRFLVGSGPGTFIYDFSTHRPASYNLGPTWSVRFSRPSATAYQILSETGVLGAISFVVVLLVGLGTIFQVWLRRGGIGKLKNMVSRIKSTASGEATAGGDEVSGTFFALGATWMTSIAMLFFVPFGTVLWFIFFTLLALMTIVGQMMGAVPQKSISLSLKATPQFALATSFIYIIVVTAVVIGGIFLGRFYGSEIFAFKAAKAFSLQDWAKSETMLGRAASLNPYRSDYYLKMSNVFLRHAAVESRREGSQPAKIGQLVSNAILASRKATTLAPISVASWEQLATMYANARSLSTDANQWVVDSLNKAIELESTNPKFYVLRGSANRVDKKTTEAKADFEKAIELKANYPLAYYLLSQVLEGEKDIDGAVTQAENAVKYAPRDLGTRFNLGRILYNRNNGGDWARAEEIFKGSLVINKDHANSLYALGLLYERQNKLGDARALYSRVLELDPNNSEIRDRINRLPAGAPQSVDTSPINEDTVEDESSQTGEAVTE